MQALSGIAPILLIFAIMYFIMLRPQIKKQKEHQAALQKLGKGDMVITRGGLIGTITGVQDNGILIIELQEKVRVRVPRAYLEGKWDPTSTAAPGTANQSAA